MGGEKNDGFPVVGRELGHDGGPEEGREEMGDAVFRWECWVSLIAPPPPKKK